MKKIFSSHGLKLAILGATMAAAGVAVAGEGGPHRFQQDRGYHACAPHGHEGFHGRAHGMHHGGKAEHGRHHAGWRNAGIVVPGYGVVSRDFLDGMGLNAEQLKLVEEARSAAKEFRESRRERMKAAHGTLGERFKAETINPEQALKEADERREQAQAERRKIDEKWLAVWKSLDAGQQARVGDHLKQRAQEAQKRAEKFRELRQQREGAKADRPAVKSS